MKIKKKEYKEQIQQAYEAGIKLALEHPDTAKAYLASDRLKEAVLNAGEAISRVFRDIGA